MSEGKLVKNLSSSFLYFESALTLFITVSHAFLCTEGSYTGFVITVCGG